MLLVKAKVDRSQRNELNVNIYSKDFAGESPEFKEIYWGVGNFEGLKKIACRKILRTRKANEIITKKNKWRTVKTKEING